MGMSKQAKQGNQRNLQETERLNRELDAYGKRLQPGLHGAQGRADQSWNTAFGGYQNILNKRGAGGGGKPFNSSAMPHFQEFARTGGVTDENKSRIRGGGVFDEFARTGGLSETDRGNIRAQSTAAIPGFFDSLSAELGRANEATGGFNPGYGSQMSMLARDKSRGAADAALNAELGITDQVNRGRQWGASSMSDAENSLASMIQSGRLAGIHGIGDLDKFGADLDFRNRSLDSSTELSALGGLGNLYGTRPGEVSMYEDLLSNALFGGAQGRRGLIQDWMQYNPNKSWAERNSPWIQAGAGILGTLAAGPLGGAAAGNLAGTPENVQRYWSPQWGM